MKTRTRVLCGSAAVVAALAPPATAHAAPGDDLNCSDFTTQVKIVEGHDPNHLDDDGDGIGCEFNAPPATAYEEYSPELAETGISPAEHPVRWMAAGGALVLAGGAVVVVSRKRRETVR